MIAGAVLCVFVWKVWVGGKDQRRDRRRRGKARIERWVGLVAQWYGLRSYLLKPQAEKEREMDERRDRRRDMRHRRLAVAEGEEADDGFPFDDDHGGAGEDVDSNDDTEDEIEQWMQAAELDHLLIEADEERHQRAGQVEGEAEDEEEEEEAEDGEAHPERLLPHVHQEWATALAATVARKDRDKAERDQERQERQGIRLFWLRLTATWVTVWALAVIALIPTFLLTLYIGRALLYPIPLRLFTDHDVFPLMAGYCLLTRLPTSGWLRAARSATARLTAVKAALLVGYFGGVFPLCVGLMMEHTLLLPARLSLHQQPLFVVRAEWAIGVVGCLFLGLGLLALQSIGGGDRRDPPGPTPLTFFSSFTLWQAHLMHVLGRPLRQTRLFSLVYDVLLPPSHFFILHLALPYVVVRGLLPMRLLLPWWVRADEYVLVSYLAGDEGVAYTSRLLESAVYRWVTLAVLMGRVGGWVNQWGREWWDAYKAAAFERRWGMRRLRNVEDDEVDAGPHGPPHPPQEGEADALDGEEDAKEGQEGEGEEKGEAEEGEGAEDEESDEEVPEVRWVEDSEEEDVERKHEHDDGNDGDADSDGGGLSDDDILDLVDLPVH